EMHGPRKVFQQEADGKDIEQHAKSTAQPVMGFARSARSVADGHFRYAGPVETREGGNEAMQLAVQVNIFQDFGAVSLEGGAKIAQIEPRSAGHEPVGDARRDLARDGVVDAILAPAAGDVIAFLDLSE